MGLRSWVGGGVALACAVAVGSVLAQAQWPERPVRIVVGFPPGGPTDFVARLIAPGLAAAWKQQVIIDNRGGANGTIGMVYMLHSRNVIFSPSDFSSISNCQSVRE